VVSAPLRQSGRTNLPLSINPPLSQHITPLTLFFLPVLSFPTPPQNCYSPPVVPGRFMRVRWAKSFALLLFFFVRLSKKPLIFGLYFFFPLSPTINNPLYCSCFGVIILYKWWSCLPGFLFLVAITMFFFVFPPLLNPGEPPLVYFCEISPGLWSPFVFIVESRDIALLLL